MKNLSSRSTSIRQKPHTCCSRKDKRLAIHSIGEANCIKLDTSRAPSSMLLLLLYIRLPFHQALEELLQELTSNPTPAPVTNSTRSPVPTDYTRDCIDRRPSSNKRGVTTGSHETQPALLNIYVNILSQNLYSVAVRGRFLVGPCSPSYLP